MKILFLSAAKSIHTIRWVNSLALRGHEIHLVFKKDHQIEGQDVLQKDICLHPLRYTGMAGYYLNAWQLKKLVKQIKPDVINVHYASGYGTLARRARLNSYLLSVWGSDVYDFPNESIIKKYILKKNIKYAKYLASTSYCMANQLKRVMNDEKLDIHITPFGVDLKEFDPYKYMQKKKDCIIIGNIKTLEKKYGINELILAFADLKKDLDKSDSKIKIKLKIYGKGSLKEELVKLISRKGLEQDVELMGAISHEKVPAALAEFDIFCALSQLDSESFGVSVVEAMAMGRPVVVSDVDGFKEVTTNETGRIVPRNDLESVKRALKELVVDEHLRIRLGENGKKRVLELYDWDKNVDTMEMLYKSILVSKENKNETEI